ncbi:hypothetical protein [Dendronalium sp. ChiSLP03b]|uniref:hypothetical protein n=1 Tax=Dendronalium sp. ChiSLP03b TaxID=3075381 RepID=UPI002AD93302|nr:hypothetical protein [Dendronalium sp. ChiSLP03b]
MTLEYSRFAALTALCYRRKPPSRQRLPFGRRQQVLHRTASPRYLTKTDEKLFFPSAFFKLVEQN